MFRIDTPNDSAIGGNEKNLDSLAQREGTITATVLPHLDTPVELHSTKRELPDTSLAFALQEGDIVFPFSLRYEYPPVDRETFVIVLTLEVDPRLPNGDTTYVEAFEITL